MAQTVNPLAPTSIPFQIMLERMCALLKDGILNWVVVAHALIPALRRQRQVNTVPGRPVLHGDPVAKQNKAKLPSVAGSKATHRNFRHKAALL